MTAVRSAWEAILVAERLGGWPIVLRPAEPAGAEGRVHHVATPAEAAALLEVGEDEVWLVEPSSSTWRTPRPAGVR